VEADVGDYLTAGRDTEIMRVHSSEPLLWRGGTLDYFDGVRWIDTTEPELDHGEEIAPGVPTTTVKQSFEILNAQTDVFFGAYEITRTSDEFATKNSDGSWSPGEPLGENSSYEVVSDIPQPTERQLRSAGTVYPPDVAQRFLQLPGNEPPIIAETAEHIQRTYNTETPYDTARAVERYLVYDGGFVYNLDVSYRRADKAIEEFLGDGKEGFCTQFATSMALLLREQGIPARVVYGATTGREAGPDEYVVTGSNMHTWVEVYFPGVGWYPFDPTPGFSMPSTMEQNAPRPEIPNAGQQSLGSDPNALSRRLQGQQTPQQPRRTAEGRSPTGPSGAERRELPWLLLALAPVLLFAAVPLVKRALVARGRPEDLYRDLTGRLRDVLPPGRSAIADSPALTPTERILLLAGAAGVEEEPMEEFARAYSSHLYSAPSPEGEARRVAAAHRRALGAYQQLPGWRRVLGAANPASVLARAQRTAWASKTRLLKALRGRLRAISRR
jgi:transglutaminase-like putative cysteine protease